MTSAKTWRWPLALAIVTLFGLLSALLGQGGVWWILSWVTLSVPVLTFVWCVVREIRHAD